MKANKTLSAVSAFLAKAFEPRSARKAREWTKMLREQNLAMRAQMKPNDGVIGFMFDPDKPRGVAIPVNTEKLLHVCGRSRERSRLDPGRIRSCAKAFRTNHNMHLMATIYINRDNEIRLLEGNHRLELLSQISSMPIVLVNVINEEGSSEGKFSGHLQRIIEICDGGSVAIRQNPEAMFCYVDYQQDGHSVHSLEEKKKDRYYTVDTLRALGA